MFPKPLKTYDDVKGMLESNKYSIIFFPSAKAQGYYAFRKLCQPLVMHLMVENIEYYNGLMIDAVNEFTLKSEINETADGVAFFVGKELSITQRGFDVDAFKTNLAKFKTLKSKKEPEPDCCTECCVIL